MARAGVYFSDVKRARDALIAKGRRPSIDAIRAELGDTGSKTTIHKYLRELEMEEGGQERPVSEAIQALVTALADQLKADADVALADLRSQIVAERTERKEEALAAHDHLAQARSSNDALAAQLVSAQQRVDAVQLQLHEEQIARSTAEQRTQDLTERLGDAERYQHSLEEKHRQAREALEYFRTAAKEQRDQENRRHEHQVQAVQAELRQTQQAAAIKQEQLTQLNKEAAGLAAELAAAKEALYREKEASLSQTRKLEQLQSVEARAASLETQGAQWRTRVAEAEIALAKATELCSELRQQKAALDAELASIRDARMLEQRIAELQRAVFGQDTREPASANSSVKDPK